MTPEIKAAWAWLTRQGLEPNYFKAVMVNQELVSQIERDIRRLSTAAAGLAGAADSFLRALDQLRASVREIKAKVGDEVE